MYILISVIFIAELIIAYQLVSLIVKLDKKVCDINECVLELKPLAQTSLQYARLLVKNLIDKTNNIIGMMTKRKEQAIAKTILFLAINVMLIIFRIREVKPNKIFKLALALLDVASDLSIVNKI